MTATKATRAEKPFTGRHMLIIICSFFGVIISVNVAMAIASSTTWTGLVVDNSYVASQAFQENLLAHRAQQAAGWTSSFAYREGEASLSITDAAGVPVFLHAVRLKLNRPVGTGGDQQVALERAADGRYVAAVSIAPGMWEALISSDDTALGPFELHDRFKVEASVP